MSVYYAHCMSIYGSHQAKRDVKLLGSLLGFVVNPSTFDQAAINKAKEAGEDVMETIFKSQVLACDALAFRALPDGRISAGVAKEIAWALGAGMLVIELPSGILSRTMDVEMTREYLRDVGQR